MAYSLGVVSRYQFDPGENHWNVVKTILKYLRNTKDQWLIYGESDLRFIGFTDSSFQSNYDDSKSVSEFIFTLNGGLSAGRVSSSTLWLIQFARQSMSLHQILPKKRCG